MPPTRTSQVIAVSLGTFMASLDLFIVNLAFPSITRDFHGTSLGSLSWVLNGYTIVFAAALVPAGRWADRVGRRRCYLIGLATFAVGSALCGVAPGVWALVATRVLQALGGAAMVPASLSLLLAIAPPARRAQAIGTWSAIGAFGAALGPVVGGALVQVDWRLVFWVNVPVALVTAIAAVRVLPESRDDDAPARPDLIGAALLAVAVGVLALGLVQAPTWGWGSARFLLALVVAAALAGAMTIRTTRHPAPVIEPVLVRSRTFSGAFAASVLYYAGFGAFLLNSVEFLTGVWHYSAVRAGLAIGPGPLMVLPFARAVAPRLAARVGAGRVAVIGCLIGAGAQALWWSLLTTHPSYVDRLLPVQLLGGAGVGLTIPSLLAAGTATLPPGSFGAGSGVLNMGRQIGTVIGVASLVAILAGLAPGDPLVVFHHGVELVAGFFLAAMVAAAALLVRRAPAKALVVVAPSSSVAP